MKKYTVFNNNGSNEGITFSSNENLCNTLDVDDIGSIVNIQFFSNDKNNKKIDNNLILYFNILRGRRILKYVRVNKADLLRLKKFLINANKDNTYKNTCEKYSHLDIRYCNNNGPVFILYSDLTVKELFAGKLGNAYDINLSKEECCYLISRIDDILEICNKKERKYISL